MSKITYPSGTAYREAMRDYPHIALQDSELKKGTVKKHKDQPIVRAGGFAYAFIVQCKNKSFGVRCFRYHSDDRVQRYQAISRQLNALHSPYFMDFEFQHKGIMIDNKHYPTVKMEWVQGDLLRSFVEKNLHHPECLENLRHSFAQLADYLAQHNIAHGDISANNVMVQNNGTKIVLIDYDGMFVPELSILNFAAETGAPNFQHPKRSAKDWGDYLDRFSFYTLDLTLCALQKYPNLFNNKEPDSIVFLKSDFQNPNQSAVFQRLLADSELRERAEQFKNICLLDDLQNIPPFASSVPLSGNLNTHNHANNVSSPKAQGKQSALLQKKLNKLQSTGYKTGNTRPVNSATENNSIPNNTRHSQAKSTQYTAKKQYHNMPYNKTQLSAEDIEFWKSVLPELVDINQDDEVLSYLQSAPELIINNNQIISLPSSIKYAKNLKRLYLNGCSNLISLPNTICQLNNLQKLSFSQCNHLIQLPNFIGDLSNLKELSVTYCPISTLPESIGQLDNLQILTLSGCQDLHELPECIGNLPNLEKLYLYDCNNVLTLPENINTDIIRGLDLDKFSHSPRENNNDTNNWQNSTQTSGQTNLARSVPNNTQNNTNVTEEMTLLKAIKTGFKKYAVFEGRATRSEFWYWQLFFWFVIAAAATIGIVAAGGNINDDDTIVGTISIFVIPLLAPSLAVQIRRLHDTGRNGWWIVLNVIPYIGGLLLLVLNCLDSQPFKNEYGECPKKIK